MRAGAGLATACDIVLAAETARFGYPEVKIGFVPAMVTAILRRNSEKKVFELLTQGFEFSAAEAENMGLVNKVFSETMRLKGCQGVRFGLWEGEWVGRGANQEASYTRSMR